MSAPRWLVALFAASFAVFGVVAAVYVFAGEGTYRDLNARRGQVTFVLPGSTVTTDGSGLVAFHSQTLAYVLGSAAEPARLLDGRPLFDESERAHLADVRSVFRAVGIAWAVAGIVLVAVVLRARLRGYALRAIRDGALWAGAAVLVLGLVAAVAFEPAFLAFHYVFFPQGNFLFDPATSNLLRLYPEEYWYGVTIRIGVAFVASAAIVAAGAAAASRARLSSAR